MQSSLPIIEYMLSYGNYFTQINPFMKIFPIESFLFLDGGNILKDPKAEFEVIENFFGVDHELNFRFNVTKGVPCLHKPVPMCLSSAKGKYSTLLLILIE